MEKRAHNDHRSVMREKMLWGLPDESQNKETSNQEKDHELQYPMDLQ